MAGGVDGIAGHTPPQKPEDTCQPLEVCMGDCLPYCYETWIMSYKLLFPGLAYMPSFILLSHVQAASLAALVKMLGSQEQCVGLMRVFWSLWSCLWGRPLNSVPYDF